MSYQNNDSIQFDLDHLSQYENVIELEEKKNELDEVYAKAQAFDEIIKFVREDVDADKWWRDLGEENK